VVEAVRLALEFFEDHNTFLFEQAVESDPGEKA
jgi:hypothetical protein